MVLFELRSVTNGAIGQIRGCWRQNEARQGREGEGEVIGKWGEIGCKKVGLGGRWRAGLWVGGQVGKEYRVRMRWGSDKILKKEESKFWCMEAAELVGGDGGVRRKREEELLYDRVL